MKPKGRMAFLARESVENGRFRAKGAFFKAIAQSHSSAVQALHRCLSEQDQMQRLVKRLPKP
jgi:hypothetical protein